MAAVQIFWPLLFFIPFSLLFHLSSSVMSESDALLKLKKSFENPIALDSWAPGSEPCAGKTAWTGVICFNGIVTGLRLDHMGLSGKIDIDALLNFPGLRTLNLKNNSFSGPMPEFNRIGALKAMYLMSNQFSGEIPDDFFSSMDSLKKVWLSGNVFTGKIPTSVSKLSHLMELHLESNRFTGSIPTINQSTLHSFDVSNNLLQGSIPVTLSRFNSSSFEGNAGLCGVQVGKICDAPEAAVSPDSATKVYEPEDTTDVGSGKVTAASVALMLVFVFMVGAAIVVAKQRDDGTEILGRENPLVRVASSDHRRKEYTRKEMNSDKAGVSELMVVNREKGVFGLPDLMKAAAEVLGNGGLGSAYKAVMANGVAVVVKRMKEMNRVGRDGFESEMRRLGRLRHQNVLTPLAYHYRKEEKLLVYEYVPNGSLLYLLHGDRGPNHATIDWPARLRIVRGIAQGMSYLHDQLSNSELPHGNLKSANVFLGPDYNPLLADYGYFPLVEPTQASQTMFAYKSPESMQYRHVSPKSDVYCLGILILEILTGKYPSQYLSHGNGGTDVVQWIVSAMAEQREVELLDPDILSLKNSHPAMRQLLHIGAACAEPNPELRPFMKEAVTRIEEIAVADMGSKGGGAGYPLPPPGPAPAPPRGEPSPSHESNVRNGYGELTTRRSLRESLGDGDIAFGIS